MSYESYINILVSGLGIIVGVLIGWQILQLININNVKKEISKEKEIFNNEKNEMMSLLYFEIAVTYFGREQNGIAFWIYSFEYYVLKSAFYAVKCKELDTLEILNQNLEKYPLPLIGRSLETDANRLELLKNFSKKELNILKLYQNIYNNINK